MRGDGQIERGNVESFIAEALTAVPDDLAKSYADKLALYSEPARSEIAARLTTALKERWLWVYKPSDFINLRPMFSALTNDPKGSKE
jgi:hypothetical protein